MATMTATGGAAPSMHDTRTTRWAGLAGLGFAVLVAAQNIWSGAAGLDPDPDASAAKILEKVVEHRDAYGVRLGTVGIGIVLLLVFLGGAWARLRDAAPLWAPVGTLGGVLIVAFFAMTNVPLTALSIGGERFADDPVLVDALWDMHLATFAFAGIALGMALLGLSLAAVAAGLVPGWFRIVGPAGAAVMLVCSVPVKAVAEGSPATMGALVGFLVWLVFLAALGTRMWREG
jgi:hypothetical protein